MQMLRRIQQRLLFLMLVMISQQSIAELFHEDNLVLLSLRYGQFQLSDNVEGYSEDEETFLLIDDFTDALNMPLTIDVDKQRIEGFLFAEMKPFTLQRKNDSWLVDVDRQKIPVPDADIRLYGGYWYVNIRSMEQWFNVQLILRYSEMVLVLKTEQPFPLIEKIKRMKQTVNDQQELMSPVVNPRVNAPYELYALPAADIRLGYAARKKDGGDMTDTTSYAFQSRGDLGYMSTSVFVNGTREDGLSGVNIRMDRFDSEEGMTGLGLSQISVGDVTASSIPFVSVDAGRGIMIGNDIVTRDTTRNTTVIEGNGYPGQEIELYYEDTLIAYQLIPDSGHYQFEDVILFVGDNNFTTKMYDDVGNVKTDTQNIVVGSSDKDVGKFKYTATLLQPDKNVINVSHQDPTDTNLTSQATFTSRYIWGRSFSTHFGMVRRETDEDTYNYYSTGFQSNFWGTSFFANVSSTEDDLIASGYAFSGKVLDVNYSVGSSFYNEEFVNEDTGDTQTVQTTQNKSQHNIALAKAWAKVSSTWKSTWDDDVNGKSQHHVWGLSGRSGLASWGNILNYSKEEVADGVASVAEGFDIYGEKETMTGVLTMNYFYSPFSIRLLTSYDVKPEYNLQTTELSLYFKPNRDIVIKPKIRHSHVANSTRYELTSAINFKYFQLNATIQHDDSLDSTSAFIQMSTSIGKRTGNFGNYYDMGVRNQSQNGSLKLRLFNDGNLNGVYDKNEELLSGGVVRSVQIGSTSTSDEAGIAWLTNMRAWEPTDIEYQKHTLDGGNLKYSGSPFSVSLRPGKAAEVDMPFNYVGEVDGTVFDVKESGMKIPVRGAIVEVVASGGGVVDRDRTDSTGYYNSDELSPGTYTLRVSDRTIISQSNKTVVIGTDGTYVNAHDIVLQSTYSTLPVKEKAENIKTILNKPGAINTIIPNVPVLTTAPVKPIVKAKPKSPRKTGNNTLQFVIQVSSYRDPIEAIKMAQRMRVLGYAAYTESFTASNGEFIRVFVGPYDARHKAEGEKNNINSKEKLGAYIVSLKGAN